MDILLVEPFLTGSHASWAEGLAAHSRHSVKIIGLEGRYWKWRMHGGAITLAHEFLTGGFCPDLLLASDMLDLSTFLAATRTHTSKLPVALYFHENQLTYPWSPEDEDSQLRRDVHYGFINYSSALVADTLLFNSDFHRQSFFAALPEFLKRFPDYQDLHNVSRLSKKSQTLHLGIDLSRLDRFKPEGKPQHSRPPLILWNHRWEYDKNPAEFFQVLYSLQDQGVAFQLAVLGEAYRQTPSEFAEARSRLGDRIVHWGFAERLEDYAFWLWRADILPVTAIHDFFGISVVEAIYCGCFPLLPQRLAYPEHLPSGCREDCFYKNTADLRERIEQACSNGSPFSPEFLQEQVKRYDWSRMAARYDALFEQLA